MADIPSAVTEQGDPLADPLAAAVDDAEELPSGSDVSPDMLQRLDEIVRHGDRASLSVKTIFLQLATEFDVTLTPPMKEVMRSEIHRLLVVLDEAAAGTFLMIWWVFLMIWLVGGLRNEGREGNSFDCVSAPQRLRPTPKWRSRRAKSTRS